MGGWGGGVSVGGEEKQEYKQAKVTRDGCKAAAEKSISLTFPQEVMEKSERVCSQFFFFFLRLGIM